MTSRLGRLFIGSAKGFGGVERRDVSRETSISQRAVMVRRGGNGLETRRRFVRILTPESHQGCEALTRPGFDTDCVLRGGVRPQYHLRPPWKGGRLLSPINGTAIENELRDGHQYRIRLTPSDLATYARCDSTKNSPRASGRGGTSARPRWPPARL